MQSVSAALLLNEQTSVKLPSDSGLKKKKKKQILLKMFSVP